MQNIEISGKVLSLILLMPCKISLNCTEMTYINCINDESHSRTALLKTNANIIPVGCVPSTAEAICRQGGVCPGGCLPGGRAFYFILIICIFKNGTAKIKENVADGENHHQIDCKKNSRSLLNSVNSPQVRGKG